MADAKSASRGRHKNESFAKVLAGPHYWIAVKTKSGRVVRIPIAGTRRKGAGKTKASKASTRPFKGTQGRDVEYKAKGQGVASKPTKPARESRYDRLITRVNKEGTRGTRATEWMPLNDATYRTPTGGMVDRGELARRRKGVADTLRQSRARRAAKVEAPAASKPAVGQRSLSFGPTLREQAAAKRASKGTREERLYVAGEKAREMVGRVKRNAIASPQMKRAQKLNRALEQEMKRAGVATYNNQVYKDRLLQLRRKTARS